MAIIDQQLRVDHAVDVPTPSQSLVRLYAIRRGWYDLDDIV